MNTFKYYLRDAREGIRRNAGAALAAVLLVFISLCITGSLYLFHTSVVDDVLDYLDEQTQIKIFVEPSANVEAMADILKAESFVQSVRIETGEETLNRMKQFFQGKAYLFPALQTGNFPDSILLGIKNKKQAGIVAEQLKSFKGVADVFYPQQFAQTVLNWSNAINRYGLMVLIVFLSASVLTVGIAIHLAMYQRQKDIRIKMLLGAKPSHVRGQFLFEGWILGWIGSLLAILVIYYIFQYVLYQLEIRFSAVFHFSLLHLELSLLGVMAAGSLIGLLGSAYSTRRWMKHA